MQYEPEFAFHDPLRAPPSLLEACRQKWPGRAVLWLMTVRGGSAAGWYLAEETYSLPICAAGCVSRGVLALGDGRTLHAGLGPETQGQHAGALEVVDGRGPTPTQQEAARHAEPVAA